MERGWWQCVAVGAVTALSGFAGTTAVVLAGLTAAGATPSQASTGLVALCATQGAGTIWLSRRYRQPITLAWSTPGAALLVSAGPAAGSWPAVVGAFIAAALVSALIAAFPGLSRLVARIPTPLAQAMLAGILLPICVRAVGAAAAAPLLALPILAAWLLLLRTVPRWATAGAFVATIVVTVLQLTVIRAQLPGLPAPAITLPALSIPVLVGIALPLVVVTMAAQNVPGAAVLAAHGYTTPWRPALLVSAIGSLIAAPFGGHAVNLAAITAALPASPDAHPDRGRRWIASATCGGLYLGLAIVSPALAGLLTGPVDGVIRVVAGIALLPTLVQALTTAGEDTRTRIPAGITVVVGASTLMIGGIGPALWSLLAGLLCWAVVSKARSAASGRGGTVRLARSNGSDSTPDDDLQGRRRRGRRNGAPR